MIEWILFSLSLVWNSRSASCQEATDENAIFSSTVVLHSLQSNVISSEVPRLFECNIRWRNWAAVLLKLKEAAWMHRRVLFFTGCCFADDVSEFPIFNLSNFFAKSDCLFGDHGVLGKTFEIWRRSGEMLTAKSISRNEFDSLPLIQRKTANAPSQLIWLLAI